MLTLNKPRASTNGRHTPAPPINYQRLYEHLLSACATYFAVDVADNALLESYAEISKHLLNAPEKVTIE